MSEKRPWWIKFAVQYTIYNYLGNGLYRKVFQFFKITGRASLEESLFSKVKRRNFYSVQLCQKLYQFHWCVPKSSSSGNFKKSTVCNITKAKPQPIFLNTQTEVCNAVSHAKNYRFHTGKVGTRTLRWDRRLRQTG